MTGSPIQQVMAVFRLAKGLPPSRIYQFAKLQAKRKLVRPKNPVSFYAKWDYRSRYWAELVKVKGLETELFPEYSKLNSHKLAGAAGVKTCKLLDGPISVDRLRLDEYGSDFVIKPDWGSSSRGVLLLHRLSQDKYLNLADGTEMRAKDIANKLTEGIKNASKGRADDLIVEESLINGEKRPIEWKVYTFYGQIGLIMAIDPNVHHGEHYKAKFYSPNWQYLGPDILKDREIDGSIGLPKHPEMLLEAAKAISLQVPTGFMRVDLFEGPEGPMLGEVCLIPGLDQYFRNGYDRKLGQMWEDANVRLLAERRALIP